MKNTESHKITKENTTIATLSNEKYSNVLNEHQKNIIKAYALTSMSSDTNQIAQRLEEVRSDLSASIDSYIEQIKDLPHLKSKLVETKQELMSENFEKIDDALITKFMIYSKLNLELDSKE